MNCAICGIRKPRRYCPGVHGDICTICCATEREHTVDCPLDCVYLRDAHDHEKKAEIPDSAIPNTDIQVTESFLRRNEPLFIVLGAAIDRAASKSPSITDNDAREALDGLVRTWRTLESGLYYESRSTNPYAASIFDAVKQSVDDLRERVQQETGMAGIRDADVLGVLAFLERLEYRGNNGRTKSKAFLEFLHRSFHAAAEQESEVAAPDEPRIIL